MSPQTTNFPIISRGIQCIKHCNFFVFALFPSFQLQQWSQIGKKEIYRLIFLPRSFYSKQQKKRRKVLCTHRIYLQIEGKIANGRRGCRDLEAYKLATRVSLKYQHYSEERERIERCIVCCKQQLASSNQRFPSRLCGS